MGGRAYSYWVPGESDPTTALVRARAQVFARGEFWGADAHPATPEEAFARSGGTGTRSILDITHIAEREEAGAANGLNRDEVVWYFDTDHPTREAIEQSEALFADIDRGCARYVRAYEGETFAGIVFVGYSFD